MTQPDLYEPSGAANYDSFAGFANTTQDEWEQQVTGGLAGTYGPLSGICALLSFLPFMDGLSLTPTSL